MFRSLFPIPEFENNSHYGIQLLVAESVIRDKRHAGYAGGEPALNRKPGCSTVGEPINRMASLNHFVYRFLDTHGK